MKVIKSKIIRRIIGCVVIFFFLWTGFCIYYIKSEGGAKPKASDTALNYVLVGDHIGIRFEDSTMERKVVFYNKVTDALVLSLGIYHYRYEYCEQNRTNPDVSLYDEFAISDMTTVRKFAHTLFLDDLTDSAKVRTAIRFVRYLSTTDLPFVIGEDIPKFFLQTLYDGAGNSADKSIMLAGILTFLGYKNVLLYDDESQVMYSGIAISEEETCICVEFNGDRYGVIDVCSHGDEISNEGIDPDRLRAVKEFSDVNCSLKYYDERMSGNLYPIDDNNVKTVDFSMKRLFLHPFASLKMDINNDDYAYYSSLPRDDYFYKYFLNGQRNQEVVANLVKNLLEKYTNSGSSEWYKTSVIINFVHNIPYVYDTDAQNVENYAQYPIETLYRNSGDCEDHAILMAAALKELGYECCLVYYDSYNNPNMEYEGHVAVAIKDNNGIFSGFYYDINGDRYYVLEATYPGWKVGSIGEDYQKACAIIDILE